MDMTFHCKNGLNKGKRNYSVKEIYFVFRIYNIAVYIFEPLWCKIVLTEVNLINKGLNRNAGMNSNKTLKAIFT